MNSTTEAIIGFLKLQDILTQTVTPKAYYLNTDRTDSKGRANSWPSLATDVPAKDNLKMSLASMLAAEQVQPKPNETILDLCAAPGMKSIYLSLLEPKITLYCNDVSRLRLQRMRALHEQYGVKAQYSLRDASSTIYSDMQFDKILVDAPCSGEGVALAGDIKMAEAWNVKKVQRLQQLQYRILKQAWKALKPGGTLIYATCTLNRSENEHVIRKALKISVEVTESELNEDKKLLLSDGQAVRILPNERSIGFFIACIKKPIDDSDGSLLEGGYLIH